MTAQPQRVTSEPKAQTARPPFGSVLASHMGVATYREGRWSESEV